MNKHILKTFIEAEKTQTEIKTFLRQSFERRRERDVQFLAAQALACQFLDEAWNEMERYKNEKAERVTDKQIGL